jgi:hypothetical protein
LTTDSTTRPSAGWSSRATAARGLEYHVAFKSDGRFRVGEICDLREQFDAFGERLMPVLKDVGIEPGKPEILEIHNIIKR